MNDENDHTHKSWLNLANIFIAIALIFILVIIIWNQSLSEKYFTSNDDMLETMALTPTVTPVELTPIPSEFYSDPADTSSILIAAVVLLVIVFGSSFWKIRSIK
ncbi:MAG TPA: hypothetical protein DCK95_08100 [Anaerolineaceae bacterium]|nr:hypothetical protein [Anaerolineaceae bacterium]